MANTKVTGDLIATGTITAANLVSGTLDSLLNSYLTTNTYATESYVTTAVNNLIDAAPASLDTLNELAAALNDDANFATTVTNALATKLNLSGGTISGNLQITGTLLDSSGDAGTSGQVLSSTATGTNWVDVSGSIDGSGTVNYVTKWSDSDTITNSIIYDDGTNVGIGTSSPATATNYVSLDIRGTNGSLLHLGNDSIQSLRLIGEGVDAWVENRTATGSLIFRTATGSERMRIDSGGNILVGTTSPILSASGRGNITINGTSSSIVSFGTNGTNTGWLYTDVNQMALSAGSNMYLNFQISGSEKMRITNGGTGVARVSTGSTYGLNTTIQNLTSPFLISCADSSGIYLHRAPNGGNTGFNAGFLIQVRAQDQFHNEVRFVSLGHNNGAEYQRMIINSSGVVSGDFNDTSDISKKENINDLVGGLNVILGLRPVSYQWKKEEQKGDHIREGFIAQEVERVMPRAVFGEEGNKSIDVTSIVSHLTKAIQELKDIVDNQQIEIDNLKAQLNG